MTVISTDPRILTLDYDRYAGAGASAMAASTTVGVGGVKRHRVATSRSQHDQYMGELQPGDWIDCRGVHFSGEIVYRKTMSAWTKVTYDSACSFTGQTSQANLPNVWVPHAEYMIFVFHCDLTNHLGGTGIMVYSCNHLVVDVKEPAAIHDNGNGGIALLPAGGGDLQNFFVRGRVHNIAQNLSYDPHAEKGTGQHCCITSDASGGTLHNGCVAIHGHSCGKGNLSGGGSVVEIGESSGSPQLEAHDVDIYAQGEDMLFQSKTQTGGNGINLWGLIGANVHCRLVLHQDSMGFATSVAPASSSSLSGCYVDAGTAKNVCQNPRFSGKNPWQRAGGVHYSTSLVPVP